MHTLDARKFFLICGDPGGANAIVPVIQKLNSDRKGMIQVFAYRQAIDVMAKNSISYTALDETTKESEIYEILQKNTPEIVITGPSFNSFDLEKKFIRSARKLHIPSLAVLDFWSNYSQRFSDGEGYLKCVPDKIAIMDETAHREMIAEGFDPDTLVITGQPAFDELAELKLQFTDEKRLKIRNDFHIHENCFFVLFVSQPLSMLYGKDESNPEYLGYSEINVLDLLINALEQISQEYDKDIVLVVRTHPREDIERYKTMASDSIRIIISQEHHPRDIVMASDIVTGMTTVLLVEACYLGCIVVSIQPGLRVNDVLPTNKIGYSIPVYSEEVLTDTFRMILKDPETRSVLKSRTEYLIQDGHATNRVVNTIYQMIDAGK